MNTRASRAHTIVRGGGGWLSLGERPAGRSPHRLLLWLWLSTFGMVVPPQPSLRLNLSRVDLLFRRPLTPLV